mmetsp:Transcript_20249/g.80875  ORF Transcript_20249/g.80875 Transcript_20249/m.80875 type:complete len:272 (-) Transcript_20249:753-1568(-)
MRSWSGRPPMGLIIIGRPPLFLLLEVGRLRSKSSSDLSSRPAPGGECIGASSETTISSSKTPSTMLRQTASLSDSACCLNDRRARAAIAQHASSTATTAPTDAPAAIATVDESDFDFLLGEVVPAVGNDGAGEGGAVGAAVGRGHGAAVDGSAVGSGTWNSVGAADVVGAAVGASGTHTQRAVSAPVPTSRLAQPTFATMPPSKRSSSEAAAFWPMSASGSPSAQSTYVDAQPGFASVSHRQSPADFSKPSQKLSVGGYATAPRAARYCAT